MSELVIFMESSFWVNKSHLQSCDFSNRFN